MLNSKLIRKINQNFYLGFDMGILDKGLSGFNKFYNNSIIKDKKENNIGMIEFSIGFIKPSHRNYSIINNH